MKIILDCNILVSAGFGKGICRDVIRHSIDYTTVCLSNEILDEYIEVSRRKKFFNTRAFLINQIEQLVAIAKFYEPLKTLLHSPHSSDVKYLDLAITAEANFIITGNLIDFPDKQYGVTSIVSPRTFLTFLNERKSYA